MKRPRLTIRTMMGVVLLFACVTWMIAAYDRTARGDLHTHLHVMVDDVSGTPPVDPAVETINMPFWSRYWRTALGLDSTWNYVCWPDSNPQTLACSFDYPEILRYQRHANGKDIAIDFHWDIIRSIRERQSIRN